MWEWIERRLKSAYLKSLEDEVKRLRDENRQLVNSMLAHAGLPTIEGPRSAQPLQPIKRVTFGSYARKMEARFNSRKPPGVAVEPPKADPGA